MDQHTKKTTCESKGHMWQSTTSPFFRHCGRTGCKATMHYINGAWRETVPGSSKPASALVTQQAELWA